LSAMTRTSPCALLLDRDMPSLRSSSSFIVQYGLFCLWQKKQRIWHKLSWEWCGHTTTCFTIPLELCENGVGLGGQRRGIVMTEGAYHICSVSKRARNTVHGGSSTRKKTISSNTGYIPVFHRQFLLI
jgi:hypothetical protein